MEYMPKDKTAVPPPTEYLPQHIGIIMDGNGRWAKARGLAREYGHRRGSEVFMDIARYCTKIGIRYLTVYAFSTENWKRPAHEVAVIMQMLQHYLDDSEQYIKEEIRLRIIGDRARLSERLQKAIDKAEKASEHFTDLTVNLAVNYGGREELLHAARRTAVQERKTPPSSNFRIWSNTCILSGNRIRILSSGLVGKNAFLILCYGRVPMLNLCLWMYCGQILPSST